MAAAIKILIIESAELIRKGIISCIQPYFKEAEYLEAESFSKAKVILNQIPVDVILTEIILDDSNGFQILNFNQQSKDKAKIIVLSSLVKKEFIVTAKQLGANAYFSRNISPELLAESIKRALLGDLFTSNEWFAMNYKDNSAFTRQTLELVNRLSKQERKVLRLFCQGMNTQEVSDFMHVQKKSVDNYKNRIAKKMELPPEIYFRDWIRNQGEYLGFILELDTY